MKSSEPKKILVVDDDIFSSNNLKTVIESWGITVLGPVRSADEVISLVSLERPDLILMDIAIEGKMNGIDTVRAINIDIKIPVIYVTAYLDSVLLKKANDTGPLGFLIKPVNDYQLYSSIETALSLSEKEKLMRESEMKYRLLFDSMSDAFVYLHAEYNDESLLEDLEIVDVNRRFNSIFNTEGKNYIGMKVTELVDGVSFANNNWKSTFSQILLENSSHKFKVSLPKLKLFLNISAYSPQKNYIAAIIEDITEKTISENEKRENDKRYRILFENSQSGKIVIRNSDFIITDCNESALEILDIRKSDLIGKECGSFFECNAAEFRRKSHLESSEDTLFIKIPGDGYRKLPVIRKIIPLTIDGEKYFIDDFIDISMQKENEEKIINAHQEISNILESIDSIIIGVNVNDIITHWSSKAHATFGIKSDDVVGKQITFSKITWDWTRIYEGILQCLTENMQSVLNDLSFTNADGRGGLLGITITPIRNRENEIKGFLIIGKDITEKRQLETQLFQDQKLKSIGELASGIAHEINTPTQYVSNNVNFLLDAFASYERVYRMFEEITENCTMDEAKTLLGQIHEITKTEDLAYLSSEIPLAINQSLEGLKTISDIVSSMKSFSHPDTQKMIITDINKLLNDTVTISRNEWKYSSELMTEFDASLPEVECVPAVLIQVFINIIVNATHAIQKAIEIKKIERGEIRIVTGKNNGNAEITVSDNGTGIPEEVIERIFDPFFTTKEMGIGTGQGLALAYSAIVKKHNGTITADSVYGEGTSFIIRLPFRQEGNTNEKDNFH